MNKVECDKCKNYYDFQDVGDIHTHCHANVCYMCMQSQGKCPFYEEGPVPEGRENDL